MTEAALSTSLREAVDDVLEKMFFVQVLGEACGERPLEELVVAHLEFEGRPSGSFTLRVTADAARSMAADFLGEEAAALPADRTAEVISELANMVCGAALSRVEKDTTFRLSPPVATLAPGDRLVQGVGGIVHNLDLLDGALSVKIVCAEPTA